jgi:16S rRNA (cytidine1402-2'-O)-methyltransferase
VRGDLAALAQIYASRETPKGEIAVVVGPPPDAEAPDDAALDAALTSALAGAPLGQAATAVAEALGLPRRMVYERALVLSGKKGGA